MLQHEELPVARLSHDEFNFGDWTAEDLGVNEYVPSDEQGQVDAAQPEPSFAADFDIEEGPISQADKREQPEEPKVEPDEDLDDPDDSPQPGSRVEKIMHKLPLASEFVKSGPNATVEVQRTIFATKDFDTAATLRALTVWIPSVYAGTGGAGVRGYEWEIHPNHGEFGPIRILTAPTVIVGEKPEGEKAHLILATMDRLRDQVITDNPTTTKDDYEPYRPQGAIDNGMFEHCRDSYKKLTDLTHVVLSKADYDDLKAEMSKRQEQSGNKAQKTIGTGDPSKATTYYWPPDGGPGDRLTINAVRERRKPMSRDAKPVGIQAEVLEPLRGYDPYHKIRGATRLFYRNEGTTLELTPDVEAEYNVAEHLDNLNKAFSKRDYR